MEFAWIDEARRDVVRRTFPPPGLRDNRLAQRDPSLSVRPEALSP
jgi:hypothetical protein